MLAVAGRVVLQRSSSRHLFQDRRSKVNLSEEGLVKVKRVTSELRSENMFGFRFAYCTCPNKRSIQNAIHDEQIELW